MNNKAIIFKLILLTTLAFVFNACVEDGDFETPNSTVTDPGLTANMTFKGVVDRYETAVANGDSIGEFDLEEGDAYGNPLVIEGYVVSSDKAGNFYEEIIIQNKMDDATSVDDPRLGFNVSINASSLSDKFEVGRKVYIKLNGLAIGNTRGLLTIGKPDGTQIEQIQSYEYLDYVFRSPDVVTISPKVVAIGDLTEADENTMIQLVDAQFDIAVLGETYAGAESDEFDGFRTIKTCADDATLLLQTSTYADFKSIVLPGDKGSISGIFSRDYGDDNNVLIINNTNDVVFTDTDRCDPAILDCTDPSGGTTIVFEEDFEGINDESELIGLGWANVNTNGGSRLLDLRSYSGNKYMQQSAYNSGENPLDTWLVTPAINFDSSTGEELTFDANAGYVNGNALSVYVSSDYAGDVATATWILLSDVSLPTGPSGGYGNFANVGNVNLSCLDGDVFIGFKYSGGDGGVTSTFQIDNIKISAN